MSCHVQIVLSVILHTTCAYGTGQAREPSQDVAVNHCVGCDTTSLQPTSKSRARCWYIFAVSFADMPGDIAKCVVGYHGSILHRYPYRVFTHYYIYVSYLKSNDVSVIVWKMAVVQRTISQLFLNI